ncbi:DUF6477 family protein [Jannaschia rubra]|uniref:Uncharacterized protein n=1 Tax=Jannaschia rubra TaxID=282197 RepID=A0A0M6XVI4_9RHOB|nr:DUF6477 family protein [Jannaschia rubra]CTQ33974.1 hypothetical protein JAN5088_02763 [Jannaschia rubra]SFG26105.1 hypothetical protein SAMN04488517_103375 [Jannaschia rubra]
MCQITKELAALRRPGLLVEAANHGTAGYERRRDLRRMLRAAIPPSPRAALERLLPLEAALEHRRRTADKNYSFPRHVDILMALLAEARAFRSTSTPA